MLRAWRNEGLVFVCVLMWATGAWAGKLGDFESDATKDRSSKDSSGHHNDSSGHHSDFYDDSDEGGLFGVILNDFFSGFFSGLFGGEGQGLSPSQDPNQPLPEPHRPGDPLRPLFRVDGSYQALADDVHAWDWRVQVGSAPFGLDVAQSRYAEDSPNDRLNMTRIHGLLRAQFADKVEVDLGLGGAWLQGQGDASAMSFTLPILIYPEPEYGFEFRPAWTAFNGSTVQEYDLAVCYNYKGLGLKAGYRWLVSPDQCLDGVYVGFVGRW